MLEANKSLLFEKLFAIYNRNLLKRRFTAFQISGLEILRETDTNFPKIIYVNHSSWWDGLASFHISNTLKMDSFILMEEKQLKKLFLFRKLGAFSVVRERPFEAMRSISYAVKLLKDKPNRTLWIFPQGKIVHNDLRPIHFYKGILKIIEMVGEGIVLPVAIKYEFLDEFKPQIFVKVGNADSFLENSFQKAKSLEDKMTVLLEQLKSDVLNKNFNNFEESDLNDFTAFDYN